VKAALGAALVALVIAGFVWPRAVMSHGSSTTTVLFDREIVRILNERCVMCHADNSLSFPLVTYEQTWLQGRSMRSSVLRRHMPPWPAVAGYGDFLNDNRLTMRETQFLVSWVEGLGPRNAGKVFLNVVDPKAGAPADIRATTHSDHWRLGEPDLTRSLAPLTVAANEGDVVKRTVIDLGLSSPRQVSALEFMPGDRRVVRAATFSVEGTGQWLGSWTPWHGFVNLPDNVAYRLPARTRIVADIHYRGASEPVVDRGTLGLFFAKSPARESATDLVIDARARRMRITADTTVWAIQPETVAGLSSLEVSVKRSDGGTDILLALTDPSPDWPTPYLLKTPRRLARGSELFVMARSKTTRPGPMRVRLSRY
jgi:hypothetical protein